MDIPLNKTIRPTKLQPKLFSIVKDLAKKKDYIAIVDGNNKPLCILMSYEIAKNIENETKWNKTDLISQMKEHYEKMPKEEQEWVEVGTTD